MLREIAHPPLYHTILLTTTLILHVAFTSYGAFWLSFATLFIPSSGIADAYTADPGMEDDAIGIFLLAWMIVTLLFL
jgi:succinate-acetate transporter protein